MFSSNPLFGGSYLGTGWWVYAVCLVLAVIGSILMLTGRAQAARAGMQPQWQPYQAPGMPYQVPPSSPGPGVPYQNPQYQQYPQYPQTPSPPQELGTPQEPQQK